MSLAHKLGQILLPFAALACIAASAQQVAAGRSDADIERFLVARYGEFVLMKPAFSPANALLWLTPFAIVGLGGAALLARRRRGPAELETPLSPDEERKLQALGSGVGDGGA